MDRVPRFVLGKLVEVRVSLRPVQHVCGTTVTRLGRSFHTHRSASTKQAGRFTSRSFSLRTMFTLERAASSPNPTPSLCPASDRGRSASCVNQTHNKQPAPRMPRGSTTTTRRCTCTLSNRKARSRTSQSALVGSCPDIWLGGPIVADDGTSSSRIQGPHSSR